MHFSGKLKAFTRTQDTKKSLDLDFIFKAEEPDSWDLSFQITGPDLNSLVIPSIIMDSQRADRLWEATCFELFCAEANQDAYLEMNFSPSTNWNVYQFDSYRKGMKTKLEISVLVLSSLSDAKLQVRAMINGDLPKITDQLQLGVSAVVQSKNKQIEYWALHHTLEKPDFHLRNNWTGRWVK